VCEKPHVKCGECAHRQFLSLTDEVTRWHLSGAEGSGEPFVAGVYPLLPDDTCRFLAIDFDKSGWREDAAACLESCRRLGLPAALERSRSGLGAHLWFFFEEHVPAALARRLGSHVLTETMEQRPELGLDSYDRLFPSQDTMPQGGFGSLIALPLQKEPRDRGNSVFLDADLNPWADQWAFLAGLQKLGRERFRRPRGRGSGPRAATDYIAAPNQVAAAYHLRSLGLSTVDAGQDGFGLRDMPAPYGAACSEIEHASVES
jgi:hypothetical protein